MISSGSESRTVLTPGIASLIHSEDECWVSQSASVTLCPCSCSQAAKWTASVDLPTPPLELATTIIMGGHYHRQTCLQALCTACRHAGLPTCLPRGTRAH